MNSSHEDDQPKPRGPVEIRLTTNYLKIQQKEKRRNFRPQRLKWPLSKDQEHETVELN